METPWPSAIQHGRGLSGVAKARKLPHGKITKDLRFSARRPRVQSIGSVTASADLETRQQRMTKRLAVALPYSLFCLFFHTCDSFDLRPYVKAARSCMRWGGKEQLDTGRPPSPPAALCSLMTKAFFRQKSRTLASRVNASNSISVHHPSCVCSRTMRRR